MQLRVIALGDRQDFLLMSPGVAPAMFSDRRVWSPLSCALRCEVKVGRDPCSLQATLKRRRSTSARDSAGSRRRRPRSRVRRVLPTQAQYSRGQYVESTSLCANATATAGGSRRRPAKAFCTVLESLLIGWVCEAEPSPNDPHKPTKAADPLAARARTARRHGGRTSLPPNHSSVAAAALPR